MRKTNKYKTILNLINKLYMYIFLISVCIVENYGLLDSFGLSQESIGILRFIGIVIVSIPKFIEIEKSIKKKPINTTIKNE